MKRLGIFALAFALCSVSAWGDIIYDNGGPLLEDPGPFAFGGFIDPAEGSFIFLLDDFVLETGSETITDVHWWGAYADDTYEPDEEIFAFLVFEDDGFGLPDLTSPVAVDLLLPTITDTGEMTDGFIYTLGEFGPSPILEYSAFLSAPLTLVAGETYWVSIIDFTSFFTDGEFNGYWSWSASDFGNGLLAGAFDGSPELLDDVRADFAFQLTNDAIVPEPASMTLLGLGLLGAAFRSRKRAA